MNKKFIMMDVNMAGMNVDYPLPIILTPSHNNDNILFKRMQEQLFSLHF